MEFPHAVSKSRPRSAGTASLFPAHHQNRQNNIARPREGRDRSSIRDRGEGRTRVVDPEDRTYRAALDVVGSLGLVRNA